MPETAISQTPYVRARQEWDERFEKMCAHLLRSFPRGLDHVADNELFNRAQVNQFGWQWYHSTKLMIPLFFDAKAAGFPLKPRDANVLSHPDLVHQRHIFLKYDLISYIRKQFRYYIRRKNGTVSPWNIQLKAETNKDITTCTSSLRDFKAINSQSSQLYQRTYRKRRKLEHCYASSSTVDRTTGDDNFYISFPSDENADVTSTAITNRDDSDDEDSVIFVASGSNETSKVSI